MLSIYVLRLESSRSGKAMGTSIGALSEEVDGAV